MNITLPPIVAKRTLYFNSFSALFFLLSGAGCSGQQDVEQLHSVATSATGGSFCSPSSIARVKRADQNKGFDLSRVWVSASPDFCAVWLDDFRGMRVLSGQVVLQGTRIPILFYANEAALTEGSAIEKVVIRMVGGPGDPIGPYGYEMAYLSNSRSPSIMVTLGHSGTAYNTRFPDENFSLATRQTTEMLEEICERMPAASFLLVGESLGGPLAVSVTQNVSSCQSRIKTLLVSPLIDSANDQILYFENIYPEKSKSGGYKNVRVNGNPETIASRELLRTYFPESDRDTSLQDRIDKIRSRKHCIWYLFGSIDPILSPDSVARFIQSNSKHSIVFDGMGHVSAPEFEVQISKTVDEIFTEDCEG